jgi:hypothetical protein
VRTCTGAEAALVELAGQRLQGPVPAGVGLERVPDQRRAYFVQGRGAFFAAVGDAPGVEVAERGAGDDPAALGFLGHALDDLTGEVAGVELRDGGHDAVQQDPAGGLVDVLTRGDQADAVGIEPLVEGDIVGAVAGEPVEFVHDDVVDPLAFGVEVAQHLLQRRPVRRGPGGAAFDELLDDLGAHGGGLLLVRLPLGGDREAFFPAAAFGLFAGGDPQVGHRALDRELRG